MRHSGSGPIRMLIAAAASLMTTGAAHAWGPHREITKAAIDALGPDDPVVRLLGDEAHIAAELSWLPDWQGQLVDRKGSFFNADDYLLFPGMTHHPGHAGKGVQESYGPYFRRALQALRTETPVNAARWLAALVHFPEDTGSPPHAFYTGGELHKRMEGWIDGGKIHIAGYHPRSLGSGEAAAVKGFEKRMEELVAYSAARGKKLKPLAEAGNREACEPIELECAEECARAVADVLRTLGECVDPPERGGVGLEGRVTSTGVPGLEQVPAKVLLPGTSYSTLADAEWRYVFRNLPPGSYKIAVVRAGNGLGRAEVALSAGRTVTKDVALPTAESPGNLMRNPDFQLRWLRKNAPDAWTMDQTAWVSEAVPVTPGRRYRLDVVWAAGGTGDAVLRWQDVVSRSDFKVKAEPALARGQTGQVYTVPEGFAFARLILRTKEDPAKSCKRVALTTEP